MLGLPFLSKLKQDVILLFPLFIQIFGIQVVSHPLDSDIVTFIDEYSWCTWVYLMKDRSELSPIFVSFLNEIKNQFGKIIEVLKNDNAKEYFSSALSSFLSSQGILQQSTCSIHHNKMEQEKGKIDIQLRLHTPYCLMQMSLFIIRVMQFSLLVF